MPKGRPAQPPPIDPTPAQQRAYVGRLYRRWIETRKRTRAAIKAGDTAATIAHLTELMHQQREAYAAAKYALLRAPVE
jgi:hypothetical protein